MRRVVALLLVPLLLLAACSRPGSPPAETPTFDAARDRAEQLAQARAALDRWDAAAAAGTVPSPGPHDANHPPAGLSAERAVIRDRTLTVHFTGSRGPATERCGVDYTAEALANDVAVVVIINERRYEPRAAERDDYACAMIGYPREATVDLPEPLGDRVVVEVRYGTAIPVTKG